MTKAVLFFLAASLGYSCVKDRPEPMVTPPVSMKDSGKVFVVNEGGLWFGNASVSLYNRLSGAVTEDYFKERNGSALGDVAQSMYRYRDNYYVVVNNSGMIVVCDLEFKMSGVIPGLTSPRYMAFNGDKAYVSDFKSGCIHVIDLLTKSKVSQINCPGFTEDLILSNGNLWVANVNREYLYLADIQTDKIIDSVWVGANESGMRLDHEGKLWLLSGGKNGVYPPALRRIDPLSRTVDKTLVFPAAATPFRLAANRKGDTLYYLNKDLFCHALTENTLSGSPMVQAGNRNFYSLAVHPNSSEIYLSDALDYVQRSNIYIYNAKGQEKSTFKAGINASGFYFE